MPHESYHETARRKLANEMGCEPPNNYVLWRALDLETRDGEAAALAVARLNEALRDERPSLEPLLGGGYTQHALDLINRLFGFLPDGRRRIAMVYGPRGRIERYELVK